TKKTRHISCSISRINLERDTSGRTMAEPSFWRNFDFTSEKIPSQVTNAAPLVKVTNNTINIMGSNTFYREAQPPEGVASSGEVVVLLHGAAFQSKTWLDLNTINLLAAMGHHIIAVDLPGSYTHYLWREGPRTWAYIS
ncbi:hypothetical protein OTU49_017123, partial [Cherax quadricarinatus]